MRGDSSGVRFAIHGGNSNNSAQVGTFYLNLNNTPSNANWNIGAAHLMKDPHGT